MRSSEPPDRNGFVPRVARSRRRRDDRNPFDSQEFDDTYAQQPPTAQTSEASRDRTGDNGPSLQPQPQPPFTQQASPDVYDDDEDEDDYVDPVDVMRNEQYTMINEMIDGLLPLYAEDHAIQNMDPEFVATNWEERIWKSSAKDDDFADYKRRIHEELQRGDDYEKDARLHVKNRVVPAVVDTLLYNAMLYYLKEGRMKIQMRSAPRRRPAVNTSEYLPNFTPDPEGDRLSALAVMNKLKNDALNADNPNRQLSRVDKERRQYRQAFQRQIQDLVALLSADDPLKNVHIVDLAAAMEDNLWDNHGGSEDADKYTKEAADWEQVMLDWETYWESDEGDVINGTTGHDSFEGCVRVEYEGRYIQSVADSGNQSGIDLNDELAALGGWDSDDVAEASNDAEDESDDDGFYIYTGDNDDNRHPNQPAYPDAVDYTYADGPLFQDIDSGASPTVQEQGTEEHIDVRSGHHQDQEAAQGSGSPSVPLEKADEHVAPAGQTNGDDSSGTTPVDPTLVQLQPAPAPLHLPGISYGDSTESTISQPQTSSTQPDVAQEAITTGENTEMEFESTPADATVHVPHTSQAAQPISPMQSTQSSVQPMQSIQTPVPSIQNVSSEDIDMTNAPHVPQVSQPMQPMQQALVSGQFAQSVTSKDVEMADDAPDAQVQQSKAIDNVHPTAAIFPALGQKKVFDPSIDNPFMPAGYKESLQEAATTFNQNVKMPPTATSRLFAAALGNRQTTVPLTIDQTPTQQSQPGLPFTPILSQPLQGSDSGQAPSLSMPSFTLDSAALSSMSTILAGIPNPPAASPSLQPPASIGNLSLTTQPQAVPDIMASLKTFADMPSSREAATQPPAQPKTGYAPLPSFGSGLASIPSMPRDRTQPYSSQVNPEDAFKQPDFAAAANDNPHSAFFGSIGGGAHVNKSNAAPFQWTMSTPRGSTPLQPKLNENAGNGTKAPLFQLNKEEKKASFSLFPLVRKETKPLFSFFPLVEKDAKPAAPPLFNTTGISFGMLESPKTAGQPKINIEFADTGDLIKTPAVLQASDEVPEKALTTTEVQQPEVSAGSADSPTADLPAAVSDEASEVMSVALAEESLAEAEKPNISAEFSYKPVGRGAQMASTFKSSLFDASAWGAGDVQFFGAAPSEPVEAIEDGETSPSSPESADEEPVQRNEEVLVASPTSASNAEVEDVDARLGDGGETVAHDQSANEHAEIAPDDAAAEVNGPLPDVAEDAPSDPPNPPSEEVSITAASQDDRSPPISTPSSRRSEEYQVLVARISSFEATADGLDEKAKDLSAQATALRVEAGEIKLCVANFAQSETNSAVKEPAQTSKIATEHEEKEATVMTEAVDVEEILKQPQEPTSVEDHAPPTSLTKQNFKDALVFGVDIINNKILPQGIKAPGVKLSVESALEPPSDKPSSGVDVSNNMILPQGMKVPGANPSVVLAPEPSSDIINTILPHGIEAPGVNASQDEDIFRRGRKRVAIPVFDDLPLQKQAPLLPLSLEDTPKLLLKSFLKDMDTQEAESLELQLSGSLGESIRIFAANSINLNLQVAELAELRLYQEEGCQFASRLVKIRLAYHKASNKSTAWDRMITDSLPESFHEVAEGLKTECRTFLRFNCLATLKTLEDITTKWRPILTLAKMYKRLVKVNADVGEVLPRWRWATSSAEKDRLGDILNEKLPYALDAYQKFYESARKLEQRAPELFTFTTLLGADICKALVDHRLEFTKWHSELNMNMPELSIDIYDDIEL
ncbi:hypothetical protein HBI12_055330 [Parastagonospora nodorum]|nr:hypothetical protein HBI12_055330 [Parastagonospora nodorum]